MGKPAARIGDMHTCPMSDGPKPHVGGPVVTGSPNVIIGGQPAARVTDTCTCVGPPDLIVQGSLGAFINGLQAARLGDATAHGGVISVGFPTAIIGDIYIGAFEAIASLVNPLGGTVNCGNIIAAVRARLTGADPNATAPLDRDGTFDEIQQRHGTTLQWNSSFSDAFNAVEAGGDGTIAIVGIEYSGGGSHVVVMANQSGHAGIIEAQDWGAESPPEVITSPARANERYNSDGGSNVGWGIVRTGSGP